MQNYDPTGRERGNLGCAKANSSGLWTGTGATSAVEQSPGLRSGGRAGARANLGSWAQGQHQSQMGSTEHAGPAGPAAGGGGASS